MTRSFAHGGSQYRLREAATINGQRKVLWQRWRLIGGGYALDCGAWFPWRSTRRDIIDMLC